MRERIFSMYFDAHIHLQDEALAHVEIASYFDQVHGCVVNGTSEADWPNVRDLAVDYPQQVISAYGIHPWQVANATQNWEATLRGYLQDDVGATVGEIGLDKWIRGYDFDAQKRVFIRQLELANEFNRPVTIHCLKAWGTLRDCLTDFQLERGFLLHAYSGPREYIDWFLGKGAYFSFSPYFVHERKHAQRDTFLHHVPLDRLLIETDAPSMLGPPETWCDEQKFLPESVQHPLNLKSVYDDCSALYEIPLGALKQQINRNFSMLFIKGEN